MAFVLIYSWLRKVFAWMLHWLRVVAGLIKKKLTQIRHWIYMRFVSRGKRPTEILGLIRDDGGRVAKSGDYWTMVAHLRDNHAFINELDDLEKGLNKKILAELRQREPNTKYAIGLAHQIRGITSCAGIIKKAVDIVYSENSQEN